MTSMREIFGPTQENRPKIRSRSKTRPPFATLEPITKPQWNRNKPPKAVVRSAIIPQTKTKSLPHAHAPDGAEFHQRRSKFVQCRNQSSQTDLETKVADTLQEKLNEIHLDDFPKTTVHPEKKSHSERTPKKLKKPTKPIEIDPNCPPGHVALTETEKQEMQSNLQKLYAEGLDELNRLPLCVDTLRVRTRRIELEKHLQITEERIKLLNKPKIYVPILDNN